MVPTHRRIATPWSRSLGLDVPILNAPMGGAAGGRLAVAVSEAGGLGMIGVGSTGTTAHLLRESAIARRAGARFGIGLIAWAVERNPELLDAAIDARPTLIAVSFGDPDGWPERAKRKGITTATQVYDVATAGRAQQAGIDVLVARGSEGGGHGANDIATLPLLQHVLDSVDIPVLAAGGIAGARGLAAVLAAGASGAWIGTAFAACTESLLPEHAREQMIAAGENDTVYTRAYDIALGLPWPSRYGERVLTTASTPRSDPPDHGSGAGQEQPINAGQGVGMVHAVRPAADVLRSLGQGAAALLGGSEPALSENRN